MQLILEHPVIFIWLTCSIIVLFKTLSGGYGKSAAIFYTIISPIICAIVIVFGTKDFFEMSKNKIEGRNREKSMERKRSA